MTNDAEPDRESEGMHVLPTATTVQPEVDRQPTAPRINIVDTITGSAFALVGLGVLVFGQELALFADVTIGPGLFPKAMGAAMLVLGIVLAVQGIRNKITTPKADRDTVGLLRIGGTLGALLILVLTFEPLGFIISSFIFLCLTFFVIQRNYKLGAFIYTVVLPPLCWVIFVKGLQAPLHEGILWF